MTHSERLAYLTAWALRDREFGLRQCRLDEPQYPGITQQVQDFLDLEQEFARRSGNWSMVMSEMAKLSRPAPTHSIPVPTHSTRRKARA